jgi:hypothetical protein
MRFRSSRENRGTRPEEQLRAQRALTRALCGADQEILWTFFPAGFCGFFWHLEIEKLQRDDGHFRGAIAIETSISRDDRHLNVVELR